MLDAYWHGDGYEAFMNECIEDQKAFDAAERVARGPIASEVDWLAREWAVLSAMAEAKGLVLFRGTPCRHGEYFNAGQAPTQPAPCTRCMLKGLVNVV